MSYLSRKTILKAYEMLSSIDSDKNQGLTQKVSALKYSTALDRYFKKYGKDCDLKKEGNKDTFSGYVGDIVKINDEISTKDFYTNISPNGRDYDCGSNFFSQSSVKDSKTNTDKTFLYPKRSGWQPTLEVNNQVLLYKPEYIESGVVFYLTTIDTRIAYAIWLARFLSINIENIGGIKTISNFIFIDIFLFLDFIKFN